MGTPSLKKTTPSFSACAILAFVQLLLLNHVMAEEIEFRQLKVRTAHHEQNAKLFEQIDAQAAGLDFKHYWVKALLPQFLAAADRSYISEGGGVTVGDVDGDGQPDVFLTRPFGGGRLFRNLGNFKFEDVTEKSGLVDKEIWFSGTSFVDIDGDGDLDLYACAYHSQNRLYINDGHGHFSEQAKRYGLNFRGASVMMAFADYDLDGDLDGYLVVNRYEFDADGRPTPRKGKVAIKREAAGGYSVDVSEQESWAVLARPDTGAPILIKTGQYNRLYRNDGEAGFVEVGAEAGVASNGLSLSATWWDFNQDGLPDLYVANDFFGPDHLYENQGDGTFRDVAPQKLSHTPWFSMGADVGDLNNDGLLDFMATDMAGASHYKSKVGMGDMDQTGWFLEMGQPRQYMRNAVYVNGGVSNPFLEIAHQANLDATDWTWSPKFGDLDCDGRLDVFVANGMTGDFFNSDISKEKIILENGKYPEKRDSNFAFRNLGNLTFEDVSHEWGLDEENVSFGAALADLDGDGDLDLIVNRYNETATAYRNQSQSGSCLKVSLQGTRSNSYGVGALVQIETTEGIQVRYHTLARGFMSTNEPILHFGLGSSEKIDKLIVNWPSGHVQTFKNLPLNQHVKITEPETSPPTKKKTNLEPKSLYVVDNGLKWRHIEQPYDDFSDQPLLPNKLSQLGTGIAVFDVNEDGKEDLYLGGGSGQPGSVALSNGQTFRPSPAAHKALRKDAASEDMGALFFDADADGDADLYVVSGGVEHGADSPLLEDRLYLNQGEGNFIRTPKAALPDVRDSGSCVSASDYDHDGDLDLFVGSRVVPGQYPVSPTSRLLRNDSTDEGVLFTDVTESTAPGLAKVGMVTSSLWSDVDGDGDTDLLLTLEWGPVKLFRNDNGKLIDATQETGLSEHLGWWNGIAGCDLDHDGDIDYAVTNFGLNTKYHPSIHDPAMVYYGDFEGQGEYQIVEAAQHGDTIWPVRGRSCSSNAMPTIAKKFKTFHEFALADLASIYTPQCLNEALELSVNELRNGILLNDGTGKFEFHALPALAQVAPGFGVEFCFANDDIHPDLYIVQNFYPAQRETGRMDGGLSVLLLGDGTGQFEPVWPNRSGLVIWADARGLVKLDLNGDGSDDFLATVNNGRIKTFLSQEPLSKTWRLRLHGPPGNPTGVGAKVSVFTTHAGKKFHHVTECYAGGSYLSQSSPQLSFPIGDSTTVDVSIAWPNGSIQKKRLNVKIDKPTEISYVPDDKKSNGNPHAHKNSP